MQWLNEPSGWQRAGDVLTVSVDQGTDFWRETGYGYIHDNGHVYGEVIAGDLDVSVRVRVNFTSHYDQAGVMLRVDERTWLKTGLEQFEGRPRLSTVLTLGQSSWTVADLPETADEITLRASRRGDAVEVRYTVGEGTSELAALVFLPPGTEVLAGVMCAAPEGPGFTVTFRDLRIAGRSWEGAAGPVAGWEQAADDEEQEWPPPEASGPGDGWTGPDERQIPEWANAPLPSSWDEAPDPDAAADWERLSAQATAGPPEAGEETGGAGGVTGPLPSAGGQEQDENTDVTQPGAAVTEPAQEPTADVTATTGDLPPVPDSIATGGGGPAAAPAGPGGLDGQDAAAPRGRAKQPTVSGTGHDDGADEWISLLTADPPDE